MGGSRRVAISPHAQNPSSASHEVPVVVRDAKTPDVAEARAEAADAAAGDAAIDVVNPITLHILPALKASSLVPAP